MPAKPHPVAVSPRCAATTLVLRDGPVLGNQGQLQVLMVQRSAKASFMPGAFVFPGGAVDELDDSAASANGSDESRAQLASRIGGPTGAGPAALAYAVAGLRECFEECGLWLGAQGDERTAAQWLALRQRALAGEHVAQLCGLEQPIADHEALDPPALVLNTSALQPWSHWVTPVGLPKRFDTLFFVARSPMGMNPRADEGETTRLAWVAPGQALAEHAAGRFPMEFATVSTVRSLLPFGHCRVEAVLAHAAQQLHLGPLHPRLKLDEQGHIAGVLLPGEAGYAQAWQG